MQKTAIATYSELLPLEPAYALVAEVDLVVIRWEEEQGRLSYYGIRHEGAAAFACSAYGKLTGRPAACLAIAGPGATNLLTGLWDANVDRAPVIALTGQVETQVLGPGAFQEIDLGAAFGKVAQWSQTVLHDSRHTELMNLTCKSAILNRGVAHLIFTDEVPKRQLDGTPSPGSPQGRLPSRNIVPPQDVLNATCDLLRGAKRPVIIVGHGARFQMEPVVALAEKLKAPVITTPFPAAGQSLELTLDLTTHQLIISSSDGWSATLSLNGQSAAGLCRRINTTLAAAGIELEPDLLADFKGKNLLPYDITAIARFRRVINWVDSVFKTFKGGLREETSPVLILPHHMDIAMNWFYGRLVPGVDPADEESADEQMNFGFVTGDSSIPDAYFYATAYPAPNYWTEFDPPVSAYWHTEGWTGAVLPYSSLAASARPRELLLDNLQSVQAHGAKLMS